MLILTPIQYFLQGISYQDFGYSILYRIFGEYKRNVEPGLKFVGSVGWTMLSGILDALIFCLVPVGSTIHRSFNSVDKDGHVVSVRAFLVFNGVILSFINFFAL